MSTKAAVAYYRTSSAANVGLDKDSVQRQRDAVTAYAKAHGLVIVQEFYDPAVSGADSVDTRPAFTEMMSVCRNGGPKVVLVENASRFARDLIVQLTGHEMLKKEGVDLIPVDAPTYFTDPTPTAEMVRQILGAVAQFEKANLVAKLKHARDRKRAETGRCEGQKGYAGNRPDVVEIARQLKQEQPKATLQQLSDMLTERQVLTAKGKPLAPNQVRRLLQA